MAAVKVQQVMEERVEVAPLIPQARTQRVVEETTDILVGVIKEIPQEQVRCPQTKREQIVDSPTPQSWTRPLKFRGRSPRSAFNAPSNKVWMCPCLRSRSGSCKLAKNAFVSIWRARRGNHVHQNGDRGEGADRRRSRAMGHEGDP